MRKQRKHASDQLGNNNRSDQRQGDDQRKLGIVISDKDAYTVGHRENAAADQRNTELLKYYPEQITEMNLI